VTNAIFIGDEITAAALRLAGVSALVPAAADVPRAFGKAVDDAELVIIAADFARALDEQLLRSAIRHADPLVLVIPDGGNRYQPEDLDARVDRVLGIEP
jgi:vacuolar-type H+-ATPase subunit F/Vma7